MRSPERDGNHLVIAGDREDSEENRKIEEGLRIYFHCAKQ